MILPKERKKREQYEGGSLELIKEQMNDLNPYFLESGQRSLDKIV